MELVVIVLNKTEKLEDLLTALADNNIGGATILDSTGMARVLSNADDTKLFGTLSMLFNPDRIESKTIFTVLHKEKVPLLKKVVREIVGDLEKPDTGIIFGLPVSFTEGIPDRD